MSAPLRVVLASGSARRRALLEAAGVHVVPVVPPIDDGSIIVRASHAPRDCTALAWFKAAQVLALGERLGAVAADARVVVAADTVCVMGDAVMGKPADAGVAREMLERSSGRCQRVVTGVCIVDIATGARELFAREASVSIGVPTQEQLQQHLDSGAWRGRAGGYNLDELVDRGWSVKCDGDRTTVVGLPMGELLKRLRRRIGQGGAK